MYGLVNRAISDMVCASFGEETWQAIRLHAEVNVDNFLSMEAYPDDLSHRLLKPASVVLGLPAVDIMQVFGLVKGLGTKFNPEINVTQTQSREEGDENDTFLIQYKPN